MASDTLLRAWKESSTFDDTGKENKGNVQNTMVLTHYYYNTIVCSSPSFLGSRIKRVPYYQSTPAVLNFIMEREQMRLKAHLS